MFVNEKQKNVAQGMSLEASGGIHFLTSGRP